MSLASVGPGAAVCRMPCRGKRLAIQTFDLHGTHITEHCYQWRLPLGG